MLPELERLYRRALEDFIDLENEDTLRRAHEVGREAIAGGIGVLQLSSTYRSILFDLLAQAPNSERAAVILERAMNFFNVSLSPFEATFSGFRDNNEKLQQSLEQLDATRQAVEMERQRYRAQFDFAPDGYFVTDVSGVIEEANLIASALLHTRQDLLVGCPLSRFMATSDFDGFDDKLQQLRNGAFERVRDWQVTVKPQVGRPFPASVTVAVIRDKSGAPVGLRWLVRDITEFKRVEDERAELLVRERVARASAEGARRLAFVAEASGLLASSLDSEATLRSVAQLTVPFLADWCFVHIVDDDGLIRRISVAQADPLKSEVARLLEEQNPPVVPDWVGAAVLSGKPQIVNDDSRNLLEPILDAAGPAVTGEGLTAHSALVVPLVARGRTLGVIVFVLIESHRVFNASDRSLAEDLGRRCAFAVDNARLHGEVIMQRDKAEKASRAKDEFLAILSHELRNPLVPILGWPRIFSTRAPIMADEVLAEGVASLERNARNIQRLVDDCLDRVRTATRTIKLAMEEVDLNQIIASSIEAVATLAREKGIKMELDLVGGGAWVVGDRTRLEQVTTNLLTNAIKFTPDGGQVTIRSARLDDAAQLEVRDTGVGIAAEFLDQIFEPFRQSSAAWLASHSGLGLGLSITREIVNLHSGRVWAESGGLNRGSRFVVVLPLLDLPSAEIPSAVTSTSEVSRVDGRIVRVLLVEDAKDVLFLMKKELEWVGLTVFAAPDGQSALEIAQREIPDVIVSDIRMPGMDGYQFIVKLRKIPALVSIPAIALTGFGMERDIEQARSAGYTEHMVKPVDLPQLITTIDRLTH